MDELFETIFVKAINQHATDIHIKLEKDLSIHFRTLGQLVSFQNYDYETGSKLMNYLKYKSFININYKMVPQTGAFHYYLDNHIYFLRVSYLPGLHFESIVMRILNNHQKLTINELTYFDKLTPFLNHICDRHSGLFLISGATGSGKSTTLYAMVDYIIEKGGRNVVTLEDPIEMKKDHCLQIEINETLGIDYHSSLKQILRHDPDVIMIGEIRDEKTAALAITCALTGHLVLSTIHASNALLVIRRMLNLHVESIDLEDVLIGILSQKIKYDYDEKKVVVLPEMIDHSQIQFFLKNQYLQYDTFKDNALYLVKEKHMNPYIFEEELHE